MTATAEERGDLAERMLPLAAHLACIVRGEGGPEDVEDALSGLTGHEQTALIVALAGLIDPDTLLADALAYLTWDEHGQPSPPVRRDHRTIRTLANRYRIRRKAPYVDHASVLRCLRGEPLMLSRDERTAAIEYGTRRMGLPFETIALRLDMELDAVKRSWERIKKRARNRGEKWPDAPRYTTDPLRRGWGRAA
ncbi:hypothetical protein [Streptomyces europaeiscabiei]|uniref:hypothetical protein n=1 Tax=Streptomyces europaeiscabiei TaxID=146819 RepID=UPI0029AE3A55|nr:hypothetical protein [Streptomyces europaeiscabiei]MDX3672777.1 hypothetical protein [Streptomyces europaeiscabiei]